MKLGTKTAWIMFVIGFLIISYDIFIVTPRENKVINCLKNIAEDYCNEKGIPLVRVHLNQKGIFEFTCKINEREGIYKNYYFLNEEIEKCKK